MIRFMICDVNVELCSKLSAVLHTLYDPCTVEYIYGPDALEVSLLHDSGGADILLTEIELRGRNSIEIIMRCMKESSPLQVIYMTQNMEYCTDVYDTRHSGFLIKPLKLQPLKHTIDRSIEQLRKKKKNSIAVQRGSNLYIVESSSLLYAENHGRILKLVTDTEEIEAYEKIGTFVYKLDQRFCHCHKSYVVNMDHVCRFCGDSFIMDDQTEIPVSQSKRKEIRQKFLDYMRKE